MGQEHVHTHPPDERSPGTHSHRQSREHHCFIPGFYIRDLAQEIHPIRAAISGAAVRAAAHKIPGLLTCRAKLIDHISSPESHLITEPTCADLTWVESASAHCDRKTSIKAAWSRSALHHTGKTGADRRAGNKGAQIDSGSTSTPFCSPPFSSVISRGGSGIKKMPRMAGSVINIHKSDGSGRSRAYQAPAGHLTGME